MYKPYTHIEGQPIQDGLEHVEYLKNRYMRERSGDFTNTTLSAKLGATAIDTMLLLPGGNSAISVQGEAEGRRITLTDMPELAAGRKNSRSGVRFGQLHISDDETAPVSELVAVKYVHRLTAPRELNAAHEINRRMRDRMTFDPIGFTKRSDGKVGYISRYEHGVTTLDNVLWNPSSSTSQRENAMAFAGLWLANLHNHGIIHGDAQAKNIAYDASKRPRYIDLEGATDVRHGNLDTETKRLLDVRDLFDPTYLKLTTPDEETLFVDSYIEQQGSRRGRLDGNDIIDTIRSAQEQAQ